MPTKVAAADRPLKVHVKKGDTVEVISGEDAGKRGKVLEVRPKEGRVVVEGVNILRKHVRPNPRTNTTGGVVEQPGPIASSKVMLVCPSCSKPTRISRQRSADGKPVRVCKHCGKPID